MSTNDKIYSYLRGLGLNGSINDMLYKWYSLKGMDEGQDYYLTRTSLFASGQQGVWYDPSNLSTLFQDSAGAVPVTAMEQPVGRMLDLSWNGNHAFQAPSTKRGVVSRRANLLLDSTTLATQSITTSAAAYKLVFSGTGSVTLSGTAAGVYGAGTNAITCTAGSLTLTVSGLVQDASFHLAIDSHLPYQWVNTATDYDADHNKFPTYIRFDGVDDAYQTNSINFTGTDKMTVWAGVTKLSVDVRGTVVELSSSSANNGSFSMLAPASTDNLQFASKGTLVTSATAADVGPSSPVITGSSSISIPSTALRVNGKQVVRNANTQGTGNYGNYPMYVGARAGTSLFFNGRLYGLIVAGANYPLPQTESVEYYMKRKMMLP